MAAQLPFGFQQLSFELQYEILGYTSLVAPYERVYYTNTGFCVCVSRQLARTIGPVNAREFFLASRAVQELAINVFYSKNEFVIEAAPPTAFAMAPAPRFLSSIVPPQGLELMKTLSVDTTMNDPDWRRVAGHVAPRMWSLRVLTIVARYDADDRIYDFGSMPVLNYLRRLVEEKIWPVMALDDRFEQLAVHLHSGAGSAIAGRDPRMEPVYFLEREDTPEKSSFYKRINNNNNNNASNGLVRFAQRNGFVEGMVYILSPKP
ncbi:hypothetical protein PG994_014461 [Apiospora phragmitis]|uniref:Uncharacterized protein n=1 Tax=Apiospora phragmitis TaxID=2905665 RepID=A0ABR1T4E0_9PEZI